MDTSGDFNYLNYVNLSEHMHKVGSKSTIPNAEIAKTSLYSALWYMRFFHRNK